MALTPLCLCLLCKHSFCGLPLFLSLSKCLLYHTLPLLSLVPPSSVFSPQTMDHNSDRNQLLQQLH